MSVNDQITRIKNNVTNSLSAVQEKGVSIPAGANSDSLPGLIAQITGGAAEIEEVTNTSGGKTVYINSEPERLPEGFTRLKYIQSDGRQHVDTLFKPNNNTRVVMDVDVLSPATSFLFGSRANSAANAQSTSFSFVQINGMSLRSDYGATETAISVNPIQRLQIDKNMNGTTVNGVYVSASSQTFDSLYNLVLFTVNTAGTINSTKTSMLLRSSQIYDNGTLVRNYIPCMNASGEAGLWDTVTQAFFGDAAGVGFVAGPVVLDYELPEGFEELAWIESDGRQHVDTNFKPNQNSRVVLTAEPTVLSSTSASWWYGVRKASAVDVLGFMTQGVDSATIWLGTASTKTTVSNLMQKVTIDQNKTKTSITYPDGSAATITNNAVTFTSDYTLFLFSINLAGTPALANFSGKTYACQIYDNGTIVRYYVPCRANTGEVGLWDAVNSVFYGDAAGVGFVAGEYPEVVELPEGYTQVEYIESSGEQYINTGILINSSTYNKYRFVFDIEYPSIGGSYWSVNGLSGGGIIYYFGLSNTGSIAYGKGTTDYQTGIIAPTGRYTIDFNPANGSFQFGSLVNNTGVSFTAPSGSGNFYLFAYNNGSTADKHSEINYGGQVYENGVLFRNYVPVINSNGAAGLYDTVGGGFYPNAGTGTFAVGRPVKPGVSKVVLEDETLIDLTGDTVTQESLLSGFTAHNAMGQLIHGAAKSGRPVATGQFYVAKAYNYTLSGLNFRPKIVFVMCKRGSANVSNDGQWLLVSYKNEAANINHYIGAYFNWSYYVDVYEYDDGNSYITTTDSGFTISLINAGGRVVNGTYYYICIGSEG